MTNQASEKIQDEMKPAIHKAMVELGHVIPTTPETVELAENQLIEDGDDSDIDESFARLSNLLKSGKPAPSFCELEESFIPLMNTELSMAARNGNGEVLPAVILDQINADIEQAFNSQAD